jgi:Na+/H+ antiporter NhaD/arsenite permease-like protein
LEWGLLVLFCLGYFALIFEKSLKANKGGIVLLLASLCWTLLVFSEKIPFPQLLEKFNDHVSDTAQLLFFLMGAMTLVEMIDSHKGFRLVTDLIGTQSMTALLWALSLITFFLSAVLDNLTTTIVMVSLLRRLVPSFEQRQIPLCAIIIAANAGGAWTPIGDVTTTMLWIQERISPGPVMRALFFPSVISLIVPLLFFTKMVKGAKIERIERKNERLEPGGYWVFVLGIFCLMAVPLFKGATGLPPFMGILLALSILWLFTDIYHYPHPLREHLRVPHILTRVDTSGILFLLGILLSVQSLETAGLLEQAALFLGKIVKSSWKLSLVLGGISAFIDNIPMVAALVHMFSLHEFPTDHSLWHLIAYSAGTGGSLSLIGSVAGVAVMGMEKMTFFRYLVLASGPALVGYLSGIGIYVLF